MWDEGRLVMAGVGGLPPRTSRREREGRTPAENMLVAFDFGSSTGVKTWHFHAIYYLTLFCHHKYLI